MAQYGLMARGDSRDFMLLLQSVTSDHTVEWNIVNKHTVTWTKFSCGQNHGPCHQRVTGGAIATSRGTSVPHHYLRHGLASKVQRSGTPGASRCHRSLGVKADQVSSRNSKSNSIGPQVKQGSLGFGLRFGSTTPKRSSLSCIRIHIFSLKWNSLL